MMSAHGAAVFGRRAAEGRGAVREKNLLEQLKDDEKRFLQALEKATGPFLQVGADKEKPLTDSFPEPVGEIARLYGLLDLDLTMTACELGIEKPEELTDLIQRNKRLRELGLGPLAREGG